MSFAFASYNDYGIVVSADHRLTGTNNDGKNFISSDTARKLFLSKQGFAVTYTGCSSVNRVPVPAKIESLWEHPESCSPLPEFFEKFVLAMSEFCEENIIFIAAGYHEGAPQIYTATTKNPKIELTSSTCYSGENDIAKKIICALPVTYDTMTLQDRIDFHRFITYSIAKHQSFSNTPQTVSETCDVVAITEGGILFTQLDELH